MEIKYSKQAIKFLKKQPPHISQRIRNAINILPAGDVKKMKGYPGYRLRVGDFRVIFDKEGNIIFIERIDNRGQVYAGYFDLMVWFYGIS